MYAGTDAGGAGAHGRIGDEIVALGAIGGTDFALGAASWRARDWLGRPCLAEGERADLVAYTSDPQEDLRVVRHPRYVVLCGRIVVDTSA
jgi:imidazolonepropionase-like amidohydrolase